MYRILGILPYIGLCNTVEKVATNFQNVIIDNYVGDLENGVDILKSSNLDKYDAIISRGGTSKLISKKTTIPVIDIGVSKYDIIHAIQATSKLNKVAIVGFDFLIDKAQSVINDFQKDINIFTINSELEVQNLILQLKKQNYDAIIGDMVTVRVANKVGVKALLISSDNESIEMALSKAIKIAYYSRTSRNLEFVLNRFLKLNKEAIVLLNEYNNIILEFNLHPKRKLLPHIKKRLALNKIDNEIFKSQGKYYLIKQDEKCNNILYVSNLAYYDWNNSNPFKVDELEKDMFEAAFKTIYTTEEQQIFHNIMDDYLPTILIGDHGTGKRFLMNEILKGRSNIISFSPTNTNINDLLDTKNISTSPLFAANNIIVFNKFNQFKNNDQDLILDFINQTLLFKRNKLFFIYEQSKKIDLLNIKQINQIFHFVKLQEIEKIDNTTAGKLITLIINKFNQNFGKNVIGMTDVAFDLFLKIRWENNLRQILFTLLGAYQITLGPYINVKELKLSYKKERSFENSQLSDQKYIANKNTITVDVSQNTSLDNLTQQLIKNILVRNDYNKTKTAQQLNISRTTLWRMLNKW